MIFQKSKTVIFSPSECEHTHIIIESGNASQVDENTFQKVFVSRSRMTTDADVAVKALG